MDEDDQRVRTVSCNVRGDFAAPVDSPDHWPRRAPVLTHLLTDLAPDLLGLQEPLAHQLDAITAALPGLTFLGDGRLGGRDGEYSALGFRTDRFRLDAWRQEALSDTPDVVGSVGWGNEVPRVLVLAELTDRLSGRAFRVVNTHLDHVSGEARRRGAARIAELVAPLDRPTVVTGDFNVDAGSEPWRLLTATGLRDTWQTATVRTPDPVGTFHDYRDPEPDGERIDWILTGPDVVVEQARIVTDAPDGVAPSDHFPILADLRLPSRH